MANRDQLVKRFLARHGKPKGDPFGSLGNLPAGTRIKRGRTGGRITEDDPRWDPKTMGNKRGRITGR